MQKENQTQGRLETFTEPAKEEKRFAVIYNLIEHTYDIHYDKYTWDEVNHHEVDCGLFGNREAASREIERLSQDWIKRGYTAFEKDPNTGQSIKGKELQLQLSNKTNSHEVIFFVRKNNIPLESLIKKDNKLYFEHFDCQYHKRLTEVQV